MVMEAMWQSWMTGEWWVPAACDLVALVAVVAILRLSARPRPAALLRVAPVAPQTEKRAVMPAVDEAPAPREEPVVRGDVKRALEAIGRWEHSYRSGRGVAELARFVQAQRPAREESPV
jgi:hypothetical protein